MYCSEVYEKYAPEKQRYIRVNLANVMDNKLNYANMLCSKLSIKFLKSRSNEDREIYKKQGHLFLSLLCQNEKDYFETLDIKSVTVNK